MSECLTLASPVTIPSKTTIEFHSVTLIFVPQKHVTIRWVDNNGVAGEAIFSDMTTPTGATVINTLNTANLTTNSLAKRALTLWMNNGYILPGTVAGTPD